jgi:3-hydroxybutyryl-CoA dehydratase
MSPGEKFSQKFVITPDVYQGFIALFNDRNELHTDATFARARGFKAEVMHGNILNGFLSYFIGECLPWRNVIIHSQEITYMKPVYLLDSLELAVEVTDVIDSVNVVQFRFRFINESQVAVAKGKIQIGIL